MRCLPTYWERSQSTSGVHCAARKPFRQSAICRSLAHQSLPSAVLTCLDTRNRVPKGFRMGRRVSESVTLRDVAGRAGVSIATASKAINGRDEVAPATRARVLRAAAELSFQPNVLARGLTSGRTRTIGLLTDELGGRFAIPILLGAENALGNEEMSVLLCDARGDAIRRRHYIRTLLARRVDGFIILGDSNDLRASVTGDIPVPVVYAYGESADPADLSVLADDEGGARLAAEHLVSLRRKHIGHITGRRPTGRRATG
ncbi:LacI family DNA-binding transcriptional regulator [Amycolatopsis lurida]